MRKLSAGLLVYRHGPAGLQVFLVHPGGPFWAKKDAGAWSIPKGEYEASEDAFEVAHREFEEETGFRAPDGGAPLRPLKQPSGKQISAWAVEGDYDAAEIKSNRFETEWPPKSGRKASFPEVDRAGWFSLTEAREKILPGQSGFLAQLEQILHSS